MTDFNENNNSDNLTEGEGFVMHPTAEDEQQAKPEENATAEQSNENGTQNSVNNGTNTPNTQDNPYNTQQNGAPYGYNNGQQNAAQNVNPYSYGQPNYNQGANYNQSANQNQGTNQNQGNPYYSNPYPYSNTSTPYAYNNNDGGGKKKSKTGVIIFIVLAVLVLLGVSVLITAGLLSNDNGSSTEKATGTPVENVVEFTSNATPDIEATSGVNGALAAKDIFSKVHSSSVGILCYANNKLASEGSGVIFMQDTTGKYTFIVTCAHVISDTGISVMVQLWDEKEYEAKVVGYDSKTDIGVLRIEASGLQAADFGDSEKLNVGDNIYAIGNPGGTEFANSFTSGMISAIDRPVSSSSTGYTMELIQHTAAINPGNSGGALVNELGQVVGINSMKIVNDEYEGMGFAVPSSVFINVVNEIISNGYVTNRPKLGITYYSAANMQAYSMFVAIKGLPSGSIVINSISSDSSLLNTEAQKGDMIIAVNGKNLDKSSDLAEIVENSAVGDKFTLSLIRVNNDYTYKQFDIEVTTVEDKGNSSPMEEETTTSIFDYFYGNGSSGQGGFNPFG